METNRNSWKLEEKMENEGGESFHAVIGVGVAHKSKRKNWGKMEKA